MKFKILLFLCFFLLMAAVPLLLAYGAVRPAANTEEGAAATETVTNDTEAVCNAAASLCKKDYCEETIKAVTTIAKNNYRLKPDEYKNADYNSDKEISEIVAECYNSCPEIYINNENKYIPCSPCSCGLTDTDESYPYIQAVASPWDCFCEDYSDSNTCVGVSLSGINYLCSNGMTAQEALRVYLSGVRFADAS